MPDERVERRSDVRGFVVRRDDNAEDEAEQDSRTAGDAPCARPIRLRCHGYWYGMRRPGEAWAAESAADQARGLEAAMRRRWRV